MWSLDKLDNYRRALDDVLHTDEYLDGGAERDNIIAAVLQDAEELETASHTLSMIFLDTELAHELNKYAEFLYEIARQYARDE